MHHHLLRGALCLLLLSGCDDGSGDSDGGPPVSDAGGGDTDGGPPVSDAGGGDADGGDTDGGDTDGGPGGAELCAAQTIPLAMDSDPGTSSVRLCVEAGADSCSTVSGSTRCANADAFLLRFARNTAAAGGPNHFVDTSAFNTLEDPTAGTPGPAFALSQIPMGAETSVTVVRTMPAMERYRVTFTINETEVVVGPITRL